MGKRFVYCIILILLSSLIVSGVPPAVIDEYGLGVGSDYPEVGDVLDTSSTEELVGELVYLTSRITENEQEIASLRKEIEELKNGNIEQSSPMNITSIVIIAAIVFLSSMVFIYFIFVKRDSKTDDKRQDKIRDYILNNLEKGYQPESIKNTLIKHGYKRKEIVKAMKNN